MTFDYRYLISNQRDLVHYYCRNLATKGYVFYTSFPLPRDKDPETIDAKLILLYQCHLPRHTVSRNRRKGLASVKYVRCGNVGYLFSTHGRGEFFTREMGYRCAFNTPFTVGGYSVSVSRDTGKVRVSLHREYQRRLKRFIMRWGTKRDASWWVKWFKGNQFSQYSGVRENLFSLIKLLNANRRDFRQDAVPWENILGKKVKVSGLLQPSSKELLSLLEFMSQSKSNGEAEAQKDCAKE
ncbi:MAG: hypothetical protein E6R03_09795 [Hyphomicrobiaceae bacterium]|nr:MAG: hypothetical protein E6R03_09795 [Hyphomicrobiaceae bacterium]